MTQTKNNVSALELKRLTSVCYRTAWRDKHKLAQVMIEREETTILSGRVEVDDPTWGVNTQEAKPVVVQRTRCHS